MSTKAKLVSEVNLNLTVEFSGDFPETLDEWFQVHNQLVESVQERAKAAVGEIIYQAIAEQGEGLEDGEEPEEYEDEDEPTEE